MKQYIRQGLLLVLMSSFQQSKGQTCDVFDFVLYPGQHVSGGSRESQGDASVATCQTRCTSNQNCIGVDFNSVNQCYLVMDFTVALVPDNNANHYRIQSGCPQESVNKYCKYAKAGLFTYDAATTVTAGTLLACEAQCVLYTACGGFDWQPSGSVCRLLLANALNVVRTGSTDAVAYYRLSCDDCPAFDVFPDQAIDESTLRRADLRTQNGCQTVCGQTTDCYGFNFISATSTCQFIIAMNVENSRTIRPGTNNFWRRCTVRQSTTTIANSFSTSTTQWSPTPSPTPSPLPTPTPTTPTPISTTPTPTPITPSPTTPAPTTPTPIPTTPIPTPITPSPTTSTPTTPTPTPTPVRMSTPVPPGTLATTERRTTTSTSARPELTSVPTQGMNFCDGIVCQNGGICIARDADFSCSCQWGFAGQFCEIQIIRDPVVLGASPNFGPVAGGTNITVTGQHFFVPTDRLFLGPENNRLECPIVYSNSTVAIGMTPPSTVTDVDLMIAIKFAGVEESYPLLEAFVYKPNPTIERIQPLEAILQGGTTLSINGRSLDSVFSPTLEITMVAIRQVQNGINESQRLFEQLCAESTAETLLCETPVISLPEEISEAINTTQHEGAINYNLRGNISLTFYLGLILDGYGAYKNISANDDLSEYGTIDVYIAGDTLISPLKEPIVYNGEPIVLQGQRMKSGLRQGDYSVYIGLGTCRVESLSDTALVCTPPSSAPDKLPDRNSEYHLIKVHAGSVLKYEYGEIYYKPSIVTWLVLGCVGGVVIIVIIIAIVCLSRRKKRCPEQRPATTDDNSIGGSMIYLPPVEDADFKDLPASRPGHIISGQEYRTFEIPNL